jgi:hypothetical protein
MYDSDSYYVPAHKNTRYALIALPSFSSSSHVVNLKNTPIREIENIDRHYFPAPRSLFLQHWIHQDNCDALGYKKDQSLQGYGVIRLCIEGYKIGPLFASSLAVAQTLFEALCSKAEKGPIYLDIPESNLKALELVKYYDMTPTFEVIRMYRNGMPSIDLQGVYGITTYELG